MTTYASEEPPKMQAIPTVFVGHGYRVVGLGSIEDFFLLC